MNGGEGFDDRGGRADGHFPTNARGPVVISDRRYDVPVEPWLSTDAPGVGLLDIRGYWKTILKFRWTVAGVVVASIVAGIIFTLMSRPIYTATASLQIDREAAKVVNVQGVEPSEQILSGDEFFQTQYGLLKSRSLTARVVEDMGLSRNSNFLEAMGEDADIFSDPKATATDRKNRVIQVVADNVSVEPVRGSRLVRISFDSPDPVLSAKVANAFSSNFISANLERRFEASTYARDFLQGLLTRTKQRLEETEKQLVAYAANQQIINVGPESGIRGQQQTDGAQSLDAASLVSINAALSAATSERIRAEQRWRQAQSSSGMGLSEILQSPTIQELSKTKAQKAALYQQQLGVYKADFPAMQQLKAEIDEFDRQIAAEVKSIKEAVRSQYIVASKQEQSLAGQVQQLKGDVLDLRSRSIQYNILQREVDTNRTLYEGLLQRYKEIGVAGGVGTNNISIVDEAEPPVKPSRPKPLLNVLMAAMVGLALGLIAAFLQEALDESINSPDDVESKLGLPLLGSVPLLEKGMTPINALSDVRSPFSEAYYSVRTALQFSTNNGVPRSLLVTSSRPSEGKSTSSFALSHSFAALGIQVLLIDGDLRNPSMHRTIQADNGFGMSNYLTGRSTLDEVLQETSVPNLSFIACGPLPPNPAELLAGPRMRALLAEAGARFDLIVVDGPPVMGLSDAVMLGSVVAGTVLVIEAGGTRRGNANNAARRLAVGRANIVGALLTKFNAKAASYGAGYSYAYQYEYGVRPQISG